VCVECLVGEQNEPTLFKVVSRLTDHRMRVPGGSAAQEAASGSMRRRRGRCSLVWQLDRGELARMVIKNDIDRLTDAKVLCKMEIYETLREFDDAVSWQLLVWNSPQCEGVLPAGDNWGNWNVTWCPADM
jgi:hypothetical protein